MLPLSLPDCDFSEANAVSLLKVGLDIQFLIQHLQISKQILKKYPQESPSEIFQDDLEEIASSNNLSTNELKQQVRYLYY